MAEFSNSHLPGCRNDAHDKAHTYPAVTQRCAGVVAGVSGFGVACMFRCRTGFSLRWHQRRVSARLEVVDHLMQRFLVRLSCRFFYAARAAIPLAVVLCALWISHTVFRCGVHSAEDLWRRLDYSDARQGATGNSRCVFKFDRDMTICRALSQAKPASGGGV